MDDNIRGTAAIVSVAGLGAPLLFTAILFGLRSWSLRRRAGRQRAWAEPDPFSLGHGVVKLAGTVETMDGDPDAAPVVVTLKGARRRVEARPFLLLLSNGVRVRVEPGKRPVLKALTRLVAGDRVFVRGLLKVPIDEALHAERGLIGAPDFGRVLLSAEAFTGEPEDGDWPLSFQLFMLIGTLLMTQLLYVKLYFDAVLWWLGSAEPPYIFRPAFSFLVLVVFSVLLGSVLSAWNERSR